MATPDPCYYSLSWALTIVQRMKEKHTRATELFEEFWGVTDRNLAVYLAKRDPIFTEIREEIKKFSNWVERGWNGFTLTALEVEVWGLRRKGRERLAERLDSYGREHTIKEQGSGGGRSEP